MPAGSAAIITIRARIGALRCPMAVRSVQSVGLTCTACRSGRSDGPTGVNKKESRTSTVIVDARQGLTTAEPQRLPKFLARL